MRARGGAGRGARARQCNGYSRTSPWRLQEFSPLLPESLRAAGSPAVRRRSTRLLKSIRDGLYVIAGRKTTCARLERCTFATLIEEAPRAPTKHAERAMQFDKAELITRETLYTNDARSRRRVRTAVNRVRSKNRPAVRRQDSGGRQRERSRLCDRRKERRRDRRIMPSIRNRRGADERSPDESARGRLGHSPANACESSPSRPARLPAEHPPCDLRDRRDTSAPSRTTRRRPAELLEGDLRGGSIQSGEHSPPPGKTRHDRPAPRRMVQRNFAGSARDEAVKVNGLRVYGSPWQPEFCDLGVQPENRSSRRSADPNDAGARVLHAPAARVRRCAGRTVGGAPDGVAVVLNDRGVRPRGRFGHIHEGADMGPPGSASDVAKSRWSTRATGSRSPAVFDLPELSSRR